jgi:hypothetical protein
VRQEGDWKITLKNKYEKMSKIYDNKQKKKTGKG